nr:hypothetical protein Iba_chr04dCG12430 [Ipomoea batatas]
MLPTTKLLSTTPEALVALSQSHSRLSSVATRHYANPLSTYSTAVAQPCADSESIIYSRYSSSLFTYHSKMISSNNANELLYVSIHAGTGECMGGGRWADDCLFGGMDMRLGSLYQVRLREVG